MTQHTEPPELAPDEKLCPFCAETIKKAAVKCRYCQSDLTETEPSTEAPPPPPPPVAEAVQEASRDEVGVAAAPPPPLAGLASRRSFLQSARLTIVLGVLCALLLAALGGAWWWSDHRTQSKSDDVIASATARDDGQEAAADLTKKVLSYNWTTLDQDIKSAEAVLVPSFRSEYDKTMAGVRDQTIKNQVQLTAKVVATSVVSATPEKVVALVFVDQLTKAKSPVQQRLDQNRVLVTLTRHGGEWRVSKMDAF